MATAKKSTDQTVCGRALTTDPFPVAILTKRHQYNKIIVVMEPIGLISAHLALGSATLDDLALLGQMVNLAAQNQLPDEAWDDAVSAITNAKIDCDDPTFHRVYRAVVVLVRNLTQRRRPQCQRVVEQIPRYFDGAPKTDWYSLTATAYTEVLAHISKFTDLHLLGYLDRCIVANAEVPLPPMMMVVDNNTTELPLDYPHLSEAMRVHFDRLNFDELGDLGILLVNHLYTMVSHEQFEGFLEPLTAQQRLQWYQLVQLLVPTTSNWTNHQLVGLLAWLKHYTLDLIPQVIDEVNTNTVTDIDAKTVGVLLDIISELCVFHVFKDGLIAYDFAIPLCQLLGTLHVHIKPATLKKLEQQPFTFPHVKSTIIEIISYMGHGNTKVQDQVRENHGLGVILSNCRIDDHNPFIKERAISCIKFLLENNPENQRVVADLEAQELTKLDAKQMQQKLEQLD